MTSGGVVTGGQPPQHCLADRGDLSEGRGNVGGGPKEDLDHGDAAQRLRFLMFDVVDGDCESALRVGDNPVRHLAGSKTCVVPYHADDGDIDFGKMSTGVRTTVMEKRIMMSRAITTNV